MLSARSAKAVPFVFLRLRLHAEPLFPWFSIQPDLVQSPNGPTSVAVATVSPNC